MRISTVISKLQKIKEKHGDIIVSAEISNPAKCIVENYLETVEEIDSFSLRDIEEPQARSIKGIDVDEVYCEDYSKNRIRKSALLILE